MNSQHAADSEARKELKLSEEFNSTCDRFEAEWLSGEHPRIENYIEGVDEPLRSRLLRELVALEVAYRRQSGETPVCSEYETRFTSDTATVREGFDGGSQTEPPSGQFKTESLVRSDTPSGQLSIRCPSCHTPMQVAVDTSLTELTCQSCGSHFSLVDQSQATQRAPPLSQLGHFELVERLGVGGFGSVWKARDKELDRTVAIKIPRQGTMTAEEQERFFNEARAVAQLRHGNIVSVHEVGRDGDSVYIVSDFVSGVTLGDWLTGQQLTSRESAELCARIADALHHAHEQGVIHRDLKPANIIIDGDVEPHLMDFGLARRDVDEVTITMDGQVLGTPAYMSPEQAQGEAHQADRRSDVYSLGVILFQLLTGELPFRGNARMLMHQVIHDEPPSPRRLNANVSKDLETITLKCLEKDPSRRYQTALECRDELQRFLAGEPIRARPLGPVSKTWRWSKRKPMTALVAAIAIGLAILGPLVAVRQHRLLYERNAALEAEKLARADAIDQREKVEKTLLEEEAARRQAEDVTEFAVALLETPSRLDAGRDSQDLSVADLFQQAAERVRERFSKRPAIAARLLFALAKSLRDIGEYQTSADLAQDSIDLSRSTNGSDSEVTLMAERLLATCLHGQGHRLEARKRLKELASRAEIVLGSRHPEYLLLCTDTAIVYAGNRQTQAIDWIEKAVLHYSTVLSEDDPDRRYIANRAGWVYCMLARHEIGLKYFEEALKLRRKYDGRLAHATLRVQHANVAWALAELGRHEEAIAHQEEALELFREKYPNNPDRWLWPQSYLIHRYVSAERYDAAIVAASEFLENCRNNGENPEDHNSWTTWELHDALYRNGLREEAKALAEQFNDCLRHVLGENDLAVDRSTLRQLRTAALYDEIDGEVESEVNRVRERFRSQRQLLGNEDADVANAAEVLAGGLAMTLPKNSGHEWSDLVEWYNPSVTTTSSDSRILNQAAIASLALGNTTEYQVLCEEALSRFRHADTVVAAERVVYTCVLVPESTSNPMEVVRLARITEQPRLVGAALYRAKEYGEALEQFNEALDAGYLFNAWDHAFKAMTLHVLGLDAEAKQSLSDARQLSNQVTSWHEKPEVAFLIREAEALIETEQETTSSNK